jgi:TolB-like protein
MSENPIAKNEFLSELNSIIDANIANEQFGVSELAEAMNMSRSNLLRKVKKETKLSVSQLISQARLNRAMEVLRTTSANVSEVSHQVGFNSPSYFIKCFREYYGFPPGEVGKRANESAPTGNAKMIPDDTVSTKEGSIAKKLIVVAVGIVCVSALVILLYIKPWAGSAKEKSIAVLPFKNDSNDSTNVYFVNGLMESTLNNLQQIKELKVTSRTSSEKYRNTSKSISEIAKELGVNYFVEGSGQKIGDRIVLNIQLIDGTTDKHLWAKQYRRETKEIFELQAEIAKNIADEIDVIITLEERNRIQKKPTNNLVAYDHYLKGRDMFYKSDRSDLLASLPHFENAIQEDPQFALAYATSAMVLYYLDIFQAEKRYSNQLTNYADKAISLDPSSGESLIAKALDFTGKREYKQALPYFEKALALNSNNGLILHFLCEFYSVYIPNPRKHLEYALLKVKNDVPIKDSATAGFNYFHLSNAFFENGFIDESMTYINRSLAYDSNGYFTRFFRVYVQYAKTNDDLKTKAGLLKEWKRDTTRFDIQQEVAKMCFMMGDYEEAYRYYKPFIETRKMLQLDLFKHEDLRIAIVFAKMGLKSESENLIRSFREYAENSQTMYRDLHFTQYYAATGESAKAIESMKLFSAQENFSYVVLWLADDPLLASVKNHPEFKKAMQEINTKFWKSHREIEAGLRTEPLP